MQIDIDMTQTQTGGNVPTKTIISAGLVGAAVPVASGALVPVAMSTFGVVTPGVGTYHAVGGLAAMLQYISTCGVITTGCTVALPTAVAVTGISYYSSDSLIKYSKKAANIVLDAVRAKL